MTRVRLAAGAEYEVDKTIAAILADITLAAPSPFVTWETTGTFTFNVYIIATMTEV